MAKGYVAIPIGYRRVDNEPLELNTLFDSYEKALEYASNDPTAYVGQLLTVLNARGQVYIYAVNSELRLSLVAREPLVVTPESAPYVLKHDTGSYPNIKCIDNHGKDVMVDVTYDDDNQVTLNWNGEFLGIVVLT